MTRTYAPSSYDDHFCLKPPALLWLAVLYLSRAFVLIVVFVASSLSGIPPEAMAMLRGTVSLYALLPSLVAAPVLYALVRRTPASAKAVRWIWAHGRIIVAGAAILDCAVSVAGSRIIGGDVADLAAGSLMTALLDVYFLAYILATPRVRDVFAHFPPPVAVCRRR